MASNQRALGALGGETVRYGGADAAGCACYYAAAAGEGADCHAGGVGVRKLVCRRGLRWSWGVHVIVEVDSLV